MNKWKGMRNGMLVAIENKRVKRSASGRRYSTWLFKCDCGNEKVMCPNDVFKKRKDNPKIKGVMSCGCQTKTYQREAKTRPDGEAGLSSLYAQYKTNCANKRGYEFDLSLDQFKKLTESNCYYCGKPPLQIKKSKTSYYTYNGIDRVDNSKGYVVSNTVPSCGECNSLKSGVSVEIAIKMLEYLGVINEAT